MLNGDTYTSYAYRSSVGGPSALRSFGHPRVATAQTARSRLAAPEMDESGRITSFREKEPGARLVSMGVYAVSRDLLSLIPPQTAVFIGDRRFPQGAETCMDICHRCRFYRYWDSSRLPGFRSASQQSVKQYTAICAIRGSKPACQTPGWLSWPYHPSTGKEENTP